MPLPSAKFNSKDMTLHYFLTNWAENSIYARFYSIKIACLRYLAEKKKSTSPRLPEMIFLEIISKMIMQIEDLAHLCLFISDMPRSVNAFYFSTNEEIAKFFEDKRFISITYIKKYMGLDFIINSSALDVENMARLEKIFQSSIEKLNNFLEGIINFWKENHLIAKHYLHGIPNFSLQEARDIAPIDITTATAEKSIRERPYDFMTLVMNDESKGRLFNNVEHTSKMVKEYLKFSFNIFYITRAIAFNELAKLDSSLKGLHYLYFFDAESKSEEDIAFVKKYFILP